MRRIVLLGLIVMLVQDAGAQHRGGFVPGFGRGGVRRSGRGRMAFPYGGYGYLPYEDDGAYGDWYPPQPGVVLQPVTLVPMAPTPAPPPLETRPVVKDYTWPAAREATVEAQVFGIVLKDGSMLSATTVVASDRVLHYVDLDERHLQVSMTAVDRAATLKLNRERKLNLYLPAAE